MHINELFRGSVSTWEAYGSLCLVRENKGWAKEIWALFIPPSWSILFWIVFHEKVPIDHNIQKCGISYPLRCYLCGSIEETITHIFLEMPFCMCLLGSSLPFFSIHPYIDSIVLDLWLYMDISLHIRNLWKVGNTYTIWLFYQLETIIVLIIISFHSKLLLLLYDDLSRKQVWCKVVQ